MIKKNDRVWVYTGSGKYSHGTVVNILKGWNPEETRKQVAVRFDAGWVAECWDTDCRTNDPVVIQDDGSGNQVTASGRVLR